MHPKSATTFKLSIEEDTINVFVYRHHVQISVMKMGALKHKQGDETGEDG